MQNIFEISAGSIVPVIDSPVVLSNIPMTVHDNRTILTGSLYINSHTVFIPNPKFNTVIDALTHSAHSFSYFSKERQLLFTAVRNLIKKNDIFNLQDQLERKVISKREFNKEIKSNPTKYIIDTHYVQDYNDVSLVHSIVSDLDLDISIDEVAEIFSFEANSFTTALSTLAS